MLAKYKKDRAAMGIKITLWFLFPYVLYTL